MKQHRASGLASSPLPLPLALWPRQEQHSLRRQLQEHLLALSFSAFLECIRLLFTKMDYADVHRSGRTAWHGRTSQGGLDLTAHAQTGVTPLVVAVQVKQYTRPVSRRFVDELRGTMLRMGAGQGLLLTTSTFSKAACRANAETSHASIAPVRLVEGEELLDWLCAYEVGVHPNRQGCWSLDEAFFARLQRNYPGRRHAHTSAHRAGTTELQQAQEGELLLKLTLRNLILTLTRKEEG